MRAGSAPAGDVRAPESLVILDYADPGAATTPAVDSISVSRSLPSELPESVVGGGGFTAAAGDVDWSQAEATRTKDDNPWRDGAVPQPGQPVQAWMSAGGVGNDLHPIFTGAVEDSSGSTGQNVSSRLVDHIYRLATSVSVPPLLRWMPPENEGGNWRRIGLGYPFVVDRVLRACGYYVTPKAEFDTAVCATLQGSVYPEFGNLIGASNAAGSDTENAHASFQQADGRLYAHDFSAAYTPRPGATPKPITTAVQVSVSVGLDHAGVTKILTHYGADNIELRITAAGNAAAYLNGVQVTVPAIPARGTRVSLLVKDGSWTLRTSGGALAGGTQAVSGTDALSSVNVNALVDARVAGINVSWPDSPSREHASLSFTPNAHIQPGGISYGLLEATPAIVNERALDVLKRISKATCSPMWLDEDGTFRWAGAGVLRGKSPVATVTAKDSILSLGWRVSLDHVRSLTTVEHREAMISRSQWPRIPLWEGRNDSISLGESLSEFIDVPSDEDWVQVDLPAMYAGVDTGGDERLNKGINSWVGGYPVDSLDGGPHGGWFIESTHGTATIQRLDDRKYLHTMNVTSVPAGAAFFATQMNPASVGLWDKWNGQNLPIVRGWAKVTWADARADAQNQYFGPVDRPQLVHDAGHWVQAPTWAVPHGDGDNPGRFADWIAQQVQTPVPEVTGLEIMPDPRIQLGDVINVEDPDNVGVAIRALITGIRLSQSGPNQSMSLSLQVISANPTHVTYAELKAAWAGADYAALEAAWTGQDYAAFTADPLQGAP